MKPRDIEILSDAVNYMGGRYRLPIEFELHGYALAELVRVGGTVHDVILKAFIELSDLGNSFNIMFHTFDIEFPEGSLRFVTQSAPFKPGQPLYFSIVLATDDAEDAKQKLQETFEVWTATVERGDGVKH